MSTSGIEASADEGLIGEPSRSINSGNRSTLTIEVFKDGAVAQPDNIRVVIMINDIKYDRLEHTVNLSGPEKGCLAYFMSFIK